jgi:hypothetical protein
MDRVYCSICGRDLLELGVDLSADPRNPCPKCGSTTRKYTEGLRNGFTVGGHSRGVGFRDELLRFITESERDGLASSAEVSENGISQELRGRPIQGERDTIGTCGQLLKAMNAAGAGWMEPSKGERDEDCVSVSRDGSEHLRIQVVRAVADSVFWETLYRDKEVSEQLLLEAAAGRLKEAIEHKAGPDAIPPKNRPDLVLALDAGRVPALAFEEAAEAFNEVHGEWARALGFDQIWVVGPDARMVHRLA